jgi:hypothetical protein
MEQSNLLGRFVSWSVVNTLPEKDRGFPRSVNYKQIRFLRFAEDGFRKLGKKKHWGQSCKTFYGCNLNIFKIG